MEVYTNTLNTATLNVPDPESFVEANAVVDNGPSQSLEVSYSEDGTIASVTLPYATNGGTITLTWEFTVNGQETSKTDYFDVVAPLVDVTTVRSALDLSTAQYTNNQILAAERRARIQVQNATGQVFSTYTGTLYAIGSNDPVLRLPKRLITLGGIGLPVEGYPFDVSSFRITNDGFGLLYQPLYPNTEIVVAGGVPITDPFAPITRVWRSARQIPISGMWGWDRVPTDVSEAAIILIESILSPESLYRERYITRMSAADWSVSFDTEAFQGTGNVVADQILAQYQVSNMAVV